MSGFYKKAVVWLGLNEEYPDDDFVSSEAPAGEREAQSSPAPSPAPVKRAPNPERASEAPRTGAKPLQDQGDPLRHNATRDRSEGTVRPVPMDEAPTASERSPSATSTSRYSPSDVSSGTVKAVPMAKTTKPQVIVPQSFNDAQDVADMFRDLKPVIVNMQNAERDLARRLIDFSSGLCYGLGGQMEKVAKDVYLLTPDEVEVAAEDRDRY